MAEQGVGRPGQHPELGAWVRRAAVVMGLLDPAAHMAERLVHGRMWGAAGGVLDVVTIGLISTAVFSFHGALDRIPRHRRAAQADLVAGDAELRAIDLRDGLDLGERTRVLRRAGDTMRIALQPVVDLRSHHVVGFEALARFPDGRSPALWFAEAHGAGIGSQLEMRAVALALDHARPGHHLAVNVSPATLSQPDLATLLASRPDADVILELTEHAVVEDYDVVMNHLAPLRAMGVRVAVDDAGSGYASMRHILSLRPDVVKLDRSLICQIHNDPARCALAASLVEFASKVGADLVAEGVELHDELVACEQLGIRFAQGYLLGEPAVVELAPSDGERGSQRSLRRV